MKKTLLTIAFGLVAATSALAQGEINFNNTTATLGRTALVINSATGTGLVGVNYAAQLYFATDAGDAFASAAVINPVSLFRVPTTTNPGTWSGGTRQFVPAVTQNQTINLIVRVWDTTLYGSYGAALAAGGVVGQSDSFSYRVPLTGEAPSAYVMNNFQSFSVAPIPEPSTIALGLLGAGSLLFLRRKK